MIFIFVVLVVCGKYGYVLYGSFGIDSDGYTADQHGKEKAYELLGVAKQAEIDQCFEDAGITKDPAKLRAEVLKFNKSSDADMKKLSDIKQCLEKKVNGYASPKQDVKDLLKDIKEMFSDPPEPQREVVFQKKVAPRLGGAYLVTAEPGYKYFVKVSGCHNQYNWDGDENRFSEVSACAGGQLSQQGGKLWYEGNTPIGKKMIDQNKPQYMAVLYVDGNVHFVGDQTYSFTPAKGMEISLSNNAPQEDKYYSQSRGGYDVLVTRIKL
jgi:hypothetical protein